MSAELEPAVDPSDLEDEVELDWALMNTAERRSYIERCLHDETPPPAGSTPRAVYERVDALARATIAHRALSAALELCKAAEAHAHKVLREAELVREEMRRAELAWQQAEAIARGLVG